MMNKYNTAQKVKFSVKDFFSKCDQIRSFLRIWSYLLKKSLMENFIFWLVEIGHNYRIKTMKNSTTASPILNSESRTCLQRQEVYCCNVAFLLLAFR